MTDTEEKLYTITEFKEVIKLINEELKYKKIYDLEYLLINHSIEDVFQVLEDNSDRYYLIKDDFFGKSTFKNFLEQYFIVVKKYYDTLLIKEGQTDKIADKYFSRLIEDTSKVYPKSNVNMLPFEVEKTLKLMKEAVQVYYKVYHNKELIATLSTSDPDKSEYLNFRIKEENLAHLLGVTSRQLKNNPDFQRLIGKRSLTSREILEWILQDIDGNQDLLQYHDDMLKKIENSEKFKLTQEQYSPDTTTQLLNYYKIGAKSQAFLKYGPFEKVSLVAKLSDNKTLSKHAKSTSATISRADSFRKYPWAYFGRVEKGEDSYLETLQIDSSKHKKELFKGSKPAIIKEIRINGDAGTEGGRIFSEEEQLSLFLEAYDAFSTTMDFIDLITYFKSLEEKHDNNLGKSR